MICFNSNAHILECLLDYWGHQLVWTPQKRQTRGTTSWSRPKRSASTNRGNNQTTYRALVLEICLQLPWCCNFHVYVPVFVDPLFPSLPVISPVCWIVKARAGEELLRTEDIVSAIEVFSSAFVPDVFPCNQRRRNMEEKIENSPGGCWRQPCNDLFWNRAVRRRAHDSRSFANLFKRRMILKLWLMVYLKIYDMIIIYHNHVYSNISIFTFLGRDPVPGTTLGSSLMSLPSPKQLTKSEQPPTPWKLEDPKCPVSPFTVQVSVNSRQCGIVPMQLGTSSIAQCTLWKGYIVNLGTFHITSLASTTWSTVSHLVTPVFSDNKGPEVAWLGCWRSMLALLLDVGRLRIAGIFSWFVLNAGAGAITSISTLALELLVASLFTASTMIKAGSSDKQMLHAHLNTVGVMDVIWLRMSDVLSQEPSFTVSSRSFDDETCWYTWNDICAEEDSQQRFAFACWMVGYRPRFYLRT